ncbi:MAG TPA: glycosyltransferase family 4 protein [Acidimicrobiia bacterium]|nr:glycosyltransferase family 4 protein [Acidimicrobiia bacterium]
MSDLHDPPPRVDVLVTSDARRGAEVFGRLLVDRLAAEGWDIELLSLTGSRQPGLKTIPLAVGGEVKGLQPSIVRAFRSRLAERRPDVILANGGATLRYAVAVSRLVRPRPGLVYRSIGEPSYWLRSSVHRTLQRLLLAGCDHVAAVSEATRSQLRGNGVPASKLSVVYRGVEEHWFDVPIEERRDRPLRILFAGSLSAEKDPLTAVQAVRALEGEAILRMAGDGPLRGEIEARGAGVELLGSVRDLAPHLRWADVLLLTSRTEGLPGVVIEAAAAGVPAVASDVGGTAEAVIHDESGYVVQPGDLGAFVTALKTLAADEPLRLRMAESARAFAAQRFSIGRSVEGYGRLLREVASR